MSCQAVTISFRCPQCGPIKKTVVAQADGKPNSTIISAIVKAAHTDEHRRGQPARDTEIGRALRITRSLNQSKGARR